MTPVEWAVVLGGLLTIAWINWYFFLAERATATASTSEAKRYSATCATTTGSTRSISNPSEG